MNYENLKRAFSSTIGGASLVNWLWTLLLCVVTYTLLSLLRSVLIEQTRGRATKYVFYGALVEVSRRFSSSLIFLIALWIGSSALNTTPLVDRWLYVFLLSGVAIQIGVVLSRVAELSIRRGMTSSISDASRAASIDLVSNAGRITTWVVVLVVLLSHLGINVSGLIAGLGIGGVAIALALQRVLGDMFASITIVLDKPFDIGDFIIVGEFQGTVESLGLRSTRVRSLSGEQIIIPNADLLQSKIRNFQRMPERRMVMSLTLHGETPLKKISSFISSLELAVKKQNQTRLERAHWKSLLGNTLIIEVVYFVLSSSYIEALDIQQNINSEVKKILEEQAIQLVAPIP